MTATIELTPIVRSFLPTDLAVSAESIEPYYRQLAEDPIDTWEAMQDWLRRWNELRRIVDQERAKRQVAASCDTQSKAVSESYLDYARNIAPKVSEWDFRLAKRYYESSFRERVRKEGMAQLDRNFAVQVELFREENVPLETRVRELVHEYDETVGAATVQFDGKEHTLPEMAKYYVETDRDLRKRAFLAVTEARTDLVDLLDDQFDRLFTVRGQIAENLGLPDYREVAFRSKLRDYTPEDCLRFHDAIEQTAVPLLRKIYEKRRATLGLATLAPYDLNVDAEGRDPLRPFDTISTLVTKTSELFHEIDPRFGVRFDAFAHSMDIESRRGKAPGAYQATFREDRRPFIFANFVGLQRDLSTMVHEAGHAIHAVQAREQELIWMDHAAMEFCEVSSMSQELMMLPGLSRFYSDPEDRRRAAIEQWESTVWIFCWVGVIDGFQHWLYTHPNHTRDERNAKFVELYQRFMPPLDWSDVPAGTLQTNWQRQLHLFHVPFYYIEYAIAQLGALQVYANYKRDPRAAVTMLLEAQTLGGSATAPRLFEVAGCRFDLGPELLGELMGMVESEIEALEH
ncbi:MAG: M3 family oligoendopeptidase [Candidatus Eisenbacteria bacterium]|nr:M3 family oligoendopeptidase [Candidatus Eisenbacteria bacterium]